MADEKICPLMPSCCEKEKCALWSEKSGCCAIKAIANHLGDITKLIDYLLAEYVEG
ncbi:MAG: hypothetical protein JRD89_12410 [Deltaproteobacteria bacterium]|nr:hypothetical protein [Deltaproteobacteria bacterium]